MQKTKGPRSQLFYFKKIGLFFIIEAITFYYQSIIERASMLLPLVCKAAAPPTASKCPNPSLYIT